MASTQRKILNIFAFRRIIIPVVIGLGVIVYMILRDINRGNLSGITWSWNAGFYFFCSLLMLVLRDAGYIYRIRLLTDKMLSWRKSFQVIMLWEFASSVTPSVVGGSAFAIFILAKEKLGAGRSTAIVIVTALLDEFFYLIMLPLVFILAGIDRLAIASNQIHVLGYTVGTMGIFYVGYAFISLLALLLSYGVFINPAGFGWILEKLTNIPFLKRFKRDARMMGNQVIETSAELKDKHFKYWAKAFGATFVSWTARFWLVNFLIMAFAGPIGWADNLLVYARQLMMWVIMLISPTPGGSGIAEYFFPIFLREFIKGPQGDLSTIVALFWRLMTYYPYLILGAFILPLWLRRVYLGRKLIRFRKTH
ncbi:MAG: lysylphosphatidylglycerol synthase transmembrane domain-containing protein [Lentimicrobiaceae bacterium]|nr:lysylphosphatidylglycerol synthase transmembrane domain-containing protein [Lentimicrobiaceae bacterium]